MTPFGQEIPAARKRPSSYGYAFLVGVVLLMACVGGFALIASQRLQTALFGSAPTATPVTSEALTSLPTLDLSQSTLYGLHMISASDGWIVGENADYALIMRYHDGHWLPVPQTVAHGTLRGVAFADAQHGWAVGSLPVSDPQATPLSSDGANLTTGLILRYQNGEWRRVLPSRTIHGTLTAIRLVAADDWWALNYQGEASPFNLIHYQRGSWSVSPLPQQVTDAHGLAVSGTDDAWVGVSGGIVHVHGIAVEQAVEGARVNLLALDLSNPPNGWAAGLAYCGAQSPSSPVCDQRVALYHYDGGAWAPVATDAHGMLEAVSSSPGGDAWAAGSTMDKRNSSSLLLHYHAGAWQQYLTTFAVDLIGISMTSPAEGWAIGFTRLADGTGNAPGLLHCHDGVWAQASLG